MASSAPIGSHSVPPCNEQSQARVLRDAHTLTATGPGAYKLHHQLRVEVSTPEMAERFRTMTLGYGDATTIDELTGSVHSAGEKKPERARKQHYSDRSPYDGVTLVSSYRYQILQLPLPNAYPAIYEFEAVTEVAENVWLPNISWRYGPNIEVVYAELEIVDPEREILYHLVDPDRIIKKDVLTKGATRLSVSALPVPTKADFKPRTELGGPAVLLAPKRGRLEGSSGDFTTWQGLGEWTAQLLQDRSTLPAEAVAEVQALVSGVDDPHERIRLVYEYMQARTHYVSIQLGIGGFKPMPPEEVHAKGYGDCKALSNYTRLLLGAADIDAYYCVIGVGDKAITLPNFASVNQANHAMVAVPLATDTVWLECTSQTAKADFLGSGSSGRRALLVKEGGGSLVRTHGLSAEDNVQTSTSTFTLSEDGSAQVERVTTYRGSTIERAYALEQLEGERRLSYLRRDFSVDVQKPQVTVLYGRDAQGLYARSTERVVLPNYVRKVGSRIAWPGYAYLSTPQGPTYLDERTTPIAFEQSYRRIDSVHYVLPKTLQLVTQLPDAEQEAPHAIYRTQAVPDANNIVSVRTFEQRAGVYPASDAAAIKEFYEQVSRADRVMLAASKAAVKGT